MAPPLKRGIEMENVKFSTPHDLTSLGTQ